ncbi:MAG: electron transfer flavoprotein subunit beta/FixA family protein [Deltaproteobacteria bacterium]|nr:electron transfer flavoprotein subunit beta/FixA family protein [Deltaproteobacteria bacterium]
MNLVVLVKHVPDTAEAELAIAADGVSVKAAGLPYQMNEWDRFALEEAVRLKEATGGTLAAFLLGPEEHEESLRRCLALGADRAVRVWDPLLESAGPLAVASMLRAALGNTPFDLILCGAQASDDGYGMVGAALAELLGTPSAALVNSIGISGERAVCTRELEGGWGEVVELDLPAVVTTQTGLNEPRYVSILGTRKARAKPIEVVDLSRAGVAPEEVGAWKNRLRLEGLEPPPVGKEAEILAGNPEDIARAFVSVLAEKAGVL